MFLINENKQAGIEKNLLRFSLGNLMLIRALPVNAVVPVKSDNLAEVEHN